MGFCVEVGLEGCISGVFWCDRGLCAKKGGGLFVTKLDVAFDDGRQVTGIFFVSCRSVCAPTSCCY